MRCVQGDISPLLSETGRKTYSTARKYTAAECVFEYVPVCIYCPPIQDSWVLLERRKKKGPVRSASSACNLKAHSLLIDTCPQLIELPPLNYLADALNAE